MNFVLCHFVTRESPYERELFSRLEVERPIGGIPDRDIQFFSPQEDWELACWLKPLAVLNTMRNFPGKNVLYLDCDALIRKPLNEVEQWDCDISWHMLGGSEDFAGGVFFRNTLAVQSFVALWLAAINEKEEYLGEQKALGRTFEQHGSRLGLKFQNMPKEYAKIFDHPTMKDVDPVIEHQQWSRKYKRIVNEKGLK